MSRVLHFHFSTHLGHCGCHVCIQLAQCVKSRRWEYLRVSHRTVSAGYAMSQILHYLRRSRQVFFSGSIPAGRVGCRSQHIANINTVPVMSLALHFHGLAHLGRSGCHVYIHREQCVRSGRRDHLLRSRLVDSSGSIPAGRVGCLSQRMSSIVAARDSFDVVSIFALCVAREECIEGPIIVHAVIRYRV